MFAHLDSDGHERVVHTRDATSGSRAIVAIHSTVLGPAFGGCPMHPYTDPAAALRDVLRLSASAILFARRFTDHRTRPIVHGNGHKADHEGRETWP